MVIKTKEKYEKTRHVKNDDKSKAVLTDEFQDVNSEKLINLLAVLDDLHILFVNLNFQVVQVLSYVLRSDISF